ncbi:vitellogenin-like isoform X2 [Scyliorhinus canicula]|uniref:vitellogenin-like isoform X2 n=1 Tax=Scyliorhinus canicula TaxID=7830 RepID=UPI0018F4DD40|nr:vitellogenin-like isoform X2 [Scyliorhinus canicula]
MMRGIIFALAFALVGSQQYEPSFSHGKTYVYQYEGVILTGLPENGLAKGGLKITSKVQIGSVGQRKHLLKIISPQIQEYSGIWPNAQFIPARKLTRKLNAQLSKPVEFDYSHGRVGNIYAQADLPENILNIYRGILNTLQISIKKSQNIYELQENGVEGICHASYVIQENKKSGIVTVTKSKDLNKCQEKISENQGSAYTQLCETCQLKGKNLRSVSTYSYAIKNTKGEAVIIEVVSKETHQFTPFNELDGAAITESRQHLVFLESKEQSPPVPTEHLVKRGTLRYQFSNELQQMPMQLTRPSNNDTNKIATALENLIQMNQERAHPDAPQRFLQFIQLLRSATLENLQSIWKKNAGTLDHRRWIWDALPTAATPEAIQFIQTKIEEGELMHGEAAKALIFVLHSIKADCHGVDNATVLLSSPYMQRDPFLRRVTLLAYGTLVNKYCATLRVCPDEALRPLHELVVEAGSRGHEYETILGLKAIGNAGQPSSLKRIQKLLPGFGTVAGSVSNRIHIEAVMALRNIAKKEPRKVQAITLQIFMNKRAAGSLRMKAFIVLLETQPSLPLIVTVADTLSRETNIQVTSFAYSYMKSLAGSSEPELQSLAASCNIAIKRLNQKCDALGYRYSKGFHFGTFKDKLLAGINANVYLLKKSEGILPTTAIINIHLYGLGVSSDFLEIGIHIEGEWRKNQPHQRGPRNERIARKVPGWKSIPTTKPLVVAWIKLFGQELSFTELHQEDLQMVKKEKERIERLLAEYIVMLQNGVTMHWTKPLLVSEIRHIVPTSLGLPMEMAFYYTVVSAAQAKMKLTVRPSNFTMVQLLNTSIQTDVQFTSSSVKDVIAVMGINTPLIQTGVEVQLKTSTVIPVDFTARVNLKKSNVKIERLPWQQEDQLFSARSRAFAFARNIEDLAAEKVTPLLSREEFRLMNSELSLVKNSTLDQQDAMEKVLPLAIPRGSVCSAQDTPDVPSPTVHQACTSSNTFGVEVCYKTSIENTAFTTDSPLYKMVGDKSIEVTIKPVTTSIAIKKLQVELQLHRGDQIIAGVRHLMRKSNGSDSAFPEPTPPDGKLALLKLKKIFSGNARHQEGANPNIFQLRFKPSESSLSENKGRLSYESSSESSSRSGISFSSSSSSSSSSQQSLSLADSVPPLFSLLTRAIMADNKEKGYQTKAYMDNSKEQRAVQLFVDELQEEGSWRACIGAEMPTVHRAVALLKWGKNCQDYKIGAKATTGHFQHHPAVLVKAQWDKIPQTLKEMAAIVADQLAGIAFMLGFSERHQKSAAHQISVITAATSQRTLDVVVKTPKHVYSRQSIHIPAPLPFNVNSPSVQQRGLFVFADFSDIISATSTAECTVVQNQFTPFTKDSFEYQMPEGCAHVLVQDCTPELQFITLIRRSGESLVVQLYLPYSEIEIQATTKGKLQLSINRTRMSIASLPFSGPRSLAIERSDNGLKIKAPELGLEKLSFDGKEIKVAVVPWMAESTCGLCGRSDSQKRNEYLQPNKRSTNEILKFAHSWLVPGENCKDDCKLMKRMVKLENSVKIHGQESKCYTIDPVLRCQIGCSPVKIAPVVYSFHCLPADSHANLNDERLISANFGQKSEDLTGPVEAHTACSCPSQCS